MWKAHDSHVDKTGDLLLCFPTFALFFSLLPPSSVLHLFSLKVLKLFLLPPQKLFALSPFSACSLSQKWLPQLPHYTQLSESACFFSQMFLLKTATSLSLKTSSLSCSLKAPLKLVIPPLLSHSSWFSFCSSFLQLTNKPNIRSNHPLKRVLTCRESLLALNKPPEYPLCHASSSTVFRSL